jgi:hypothetical protein
MQVRNDSYAKLQERLRISNFREPRRQSNQNQPNNRILFKISTKFSLFSVLKNQIYQRITKQYKYKYDFLCITYFKIKTVFQLKILRV